MIIDIDGVMSDRTAMIDPGTIEGARGVMRWNIGAERHESPVLIEEISGTWIRVLPEGPAQPISHGAAARLVVRRDARVPEGFRGLDIDLTYAGPAGSGSASSAGEGSKGGSDGFRGLVAGGSLHFRLGKIRGSERVHPRRKVRVRGPEGDIMMQIKLLDWEYDRSFFKRYVFHSSTENLVAGEVAVFSMSDNIYDRSTGDPVSISTSLSVNLKAVVSDISENGVQLVVVRGCMMSPINQNTALRISMLFPMVGKSRAMAMSLYGRAVEIRETGDGDRIFHIAFLRPQPSLSSALNFLAERYPPGGSTLAGLPAA